MDIPESYAVRMKELLGEEYPAYLASMDQEREYSLRVNTLRWSIEQAVEELSKASGGEHGTDGPFRGDDGLSAREVSCRDRDSSSWEVSCGDAGSSMREASCKRGCTSGCGLVRVPWVSQGFYYDASVWRPAKTPYFHAGMFYLQEASAMTPGDVIPVKPGDRVLDLCAAPGGKSTQVAARLAGEGVLYANDISASRAQALLKNLEMAGVPNIFVTAETPEKLAERFPSYFDAILVDAPCSGEGMIRKDAAMFRDWLAKGPSFYQPIQAQILRTAATMLKPGGHLLYSTCTFSREEDEDNVISFLEDTPEMELVPIPLRPGFSEGFLEGSIRLWPHHTRGEGHFLALMRKKGAAGSVDECDRSRSVSDGESGVGFVDKVSFGDELDALAVRGLSCGTLSDEELAPMGGGSAIRSGSKGGMASAEGSVIEKKESSIRRDSKGRTRYDERSAEGGSDIARYEDSGRGSGKKSSRDYAKDSRKKKSDRGFGDRKTRGRQASAMKAGNGTLTVEVNHEDFPLKSDCPEILACRNIVLQGDRLYAIPEGERVQPGIHYLRTGLLLGEWKKEKFVPSQALAMVLDGRAYPNRISLSWEDVRVTRYLKGETLFLEEGEAIGEEGWCLICAEGYPLGWAQRKGLQLKNRYATGWRML